MEQKRNASAAVSADFSTHPLREHSLTAVVQSALSQAKTDLGSLRLFDLDVDESGWVPAAGLPVYTGLYGRDVLTAGWEAAMLGPEMMRGALHHLARLQGKERNDWRDEDPGKMIHEARTGPLSQLNFIPNGLYYGSVTTSGFYSLVLSELWHWTGDKDLIRPFLEPALSALQWMDEGSDLDSDGFYEYQTRSRKGLRNQGWKDSDDGVLDEHGNAVSTPIATCEEQAFVYVAKLHLSEVLWWMDQKSEAHRLYHEAEELRKRFSEKFWLPADRYPALALDAQKRAIPTIASNAGHCVAAGIMEQEHVVSTVRRMMSDELFTGWGVRTLSNQHPAFNPYSYHRGSVWPVEQATFVLGMVRYGLHREAAELARAFFEAASCFEFCRLPELFAGHRRDANHPFPAAYPEACWPQAWSSSAVFGVIQSLLGLYPYAPLHILIVDPYLPDWLPEITVTHLRIGRAVVDLHFSRRSDGQTGFQIKRLEGPLHVIRQPSPWSITAGFAERTKDLLTSFI
jgi:glycogen debranching enzyme